MFDFKKLDTFFANDNLKKPVDEKDSGFKQRTKLVRTAKLLLPAVAAALIGLLAIMPSLKDRDNEFNINLPHPKSGELEKLHMENTVFYITDSQNRVNNFTAETVDETEPGSKLVKLIKPEGLLPSSDAQWVSIKSPIGYYDQNKKLLWLDEDVKMVYSDGMNANTERVYYDANTSKSYSLTPVTADGYFGNLQSEGFEYYSDKKLIIFTGKSKIVIHQESFEGK